MGCISRGVFRPHHGWEAARPHVKAIKVPGHLKESEISERPAKISISIWHPFSSVIVRTSAELPWTWVYLGNSCPCLRPSRTAAFRAINYLDAALIKRQHERDFQMDGWNMGRAICRMHPYGCGRRGWRVYECDESWLEREIQLSREQFAAIHLTVPRMRAHFCREERFLCSPERREIFGTREEERERSSHKVKGKFNKLSLKSAVYFPLGLGLFYSHKIQ